MPCADRPPVPLGNRPTGQDLGEGFRKLGEIERFRSTLISVGEVTMTDPEGTPFVRHVVHHPGAVAVVPVGDDGTVTLVRQFRPAIEQFVLEIPAGTRDRHAEPLEQTARRELAEEAGLLASDLQRLIAVYNTPGYSDQLTTIFLATGLAPCNTDRSGVEERFMDVAQVSLRDVSSLVARGELIDETTVLGLLLAEKALASPVPASKGTTQ